MPDALVAAQAGCRVTAVLGAGLPDEWVATALARRFPTERLVIAFDADDRGRVGSARLAELLDGVGARARAALMEVPSAAGDLNGWQPHSPEAFDRALSSAVERARPHLDSTRAEPMPAGLSDLLDAVHQRHVLVEDPELASRNLAALRRSVNRWDRGGLQPAPSEHPPPRSRLAKDLETLEVKYLSRVDGADVERTIGQVSAAVADWSSGPSMPGTARGRWLEVALRGRGADGVDASSRGPSIETGLGIDR